MKRLEYQTKQNFTLPYIYIAKVVNTEDNEKRNRVQVRIIGMTDDNTLDSECIWAEQSTSIFSGTAESSGISSVPNKGTYVYIQFLYGDPSFPVYTGYVRGNADSSFLNKVESLDKTIFKIRNDNIIGPELPPLNDKSKYPDNNVIETKGGNIIELDDTDGNERIAIEHKSGSYIEIRPDGTIQVKTNNDSYEIVKNNKKVYIAGDVSTEIKGKWDINVTGDITMKASNIYLN